MNDFVRPITSTRDLPQGDYRFKPRVKLFPANNDPSTLETEINDWLDTQATLPDLFTDVVSVQYTSAQLKNNEIQYSALVYYTQIDVV